MDIAIGTLVAYLRDGLETAREFTSSSPTSTTTVLPPFGSTCARSPNRTVSAASPFPNITRSISSTSGLNRPPALRRPRPSFSRSSAFCMPSSKSLKSKGSSSLGFSVGTASAALGSCLPLRLSRVGVLERWRRGEVVEGGGTGHLLGCWVGLRIKGGLEKLWRNALEQGPVVGFLEMTATHRSSRGGMGVEERITATIHRLLSR